MAEVSKDIKKKIMNLIRDDPISVSELARILKLRREFVSGYMEALHHNGEVKVVTVGKSKVYRPR